MRVIEVPATRAGYQTVVHMGEPIVGSKQGVSEIMHSPKFLHKSIPGFPHALSGATQLGSEGGDCHKHDC